MLKMLDPPRDSARPSAERNVRLSFAKQADQCQQHRCTPWLGWDLLNRVLQYSERYELAS